MKSRISLTSTKARKEFTAEFKLVEKESKDYGENNDCSVKAVAIVSGLSYGYVRTLFLSKGREHRKPTPRSVTFAVLQELGIVTRQINKTPKTVGRCEKELDKAHKFLVFTSNHMLAVSSGEAHCWTRDRQHRPTSVFRVM